MRKKNNRHEVGTIYQVTKLTKDRVRGWTSRFVVYKGKVSSASPIIRPDVIGKTLKEVREWAKKKGYYVQWVER